MINLFEACPACGGPIVITECRCSTCRLEMRGEFRTGQLAALSDDQLAFVRVFLRSRGNLSDVERVLGVSYPTIRNKLDEINTPLDRAEASHTQPTAVGERTLPASQTASRHAARQAILRRVTDGELTVLEALETLRSMKGEK